MGSKETRRILKHACTGRLAIVALSAQPPGVNELCVCVCSFAAPGELALGDSHRQAVGTMNSYLLVVSGVNPLNGDQSESAVLARPHNHTKIRGKRDTKTIRLLFIRPALGPRSWSYITSESGVAQKGRQDTSELALLSEEPRI